MPSLLFQATSITLLLLPFLTFSTSTLVDLDNDPILNGGTYYIIPVESKTGLTYTQKKHTCPLYITPEKTDNSPGTPIRISSIFRTMYIRQDERVTLAFEGSTPCDDESLVWSPTIDAWARKAYITTGGDKGARSFSITKIDRTLLPTYELRYWPSDEVSSNVGLYENDGLLGLTEYSSTVSFKKAFDVLELPSTTTS